MSFSVLHLKKTLPALLLLLAAVSFSQTRPDAMSNYWAGRDLERQGKPDEAKGYYSEAVRICFQEINEKTATMDTYVALSMTLLRQEKYADVITWGEQGLKIRGDARLMETMGEAYFYLEKYADSLRYMQRYVNAVPEGDRSGTAYFFIGEIFRIQKKFHHADIAYTTALKLQPSASLWWFRLGTVKEAFGEAAGARAAYEQAVKISPNDKRYVDGLNRVRG